MLKKEYSITTKAIIGLIMVSFLSSLFIGDFQNRSMVDSALKESNDTSIVLADARNREAIYRKIIANSYEVTFYDFFVPYNTTKRLPGSKDWYMHVIKDGENEHAFLYQKGRKYTKIDLLKMERSPAASEGKSTYYIPTFGKTGINDNDKITEGLGFYLIKLKEPDIH